MTHGRADGLSYRFDVRPARDAYASHRRTARRPFDSYLGRMRNAKSNYDCVIAQEALGAHEPRFDEMQPTSDSTGSTKITAASFCDTAGPT
jgi:hypothetical protein